MAFLAGNKGKVTLGSDTVIGMGSWKLNGITVDQLETTSFGDTAKQYITGLLDYGTVEFSGLYDPSDASGQQVLIAAMLGNEKITDIRLYVDDTSYWTPNLTTSEGGDEDAGMYLTAVPIGMDKSGVGTISFSGKCTGPWCLV